MTATPSPTPKPAVGTLEQRLAVARSVNVETSILGLELGADLKTAHAKLDPLGEFITPPRDEDEGERESKVLWNLKETDYRAVLIKTDEKEHVISITGYLREDNLRPFNDIADTKVAPVLNDNQVAWDVVRPDHPHTRVVATGNDGKASVITIFVVQHPRTHN
ncbi:MAG: hypothetical protein ACXWG7_05390 [Chthoniobacterales bacterium]